MNRAELLAARIEQGGRQLAAFAEELSSTEWRTPFSQTDKRTLGVIVHHVASVYPVEIDLALAVAGGKTVTDVTPEAVNAMNAEHSRVNRDVTKAEALELLIRNSTAAAAAVRKLTDAELDRAAPFSLNWGAPLTAQFVLEDHAVRHSWHHLGRLREALGRTVESVGRAEAVSSR